MAATEGDAQVSRGDADRPPVRQRPMVVDMARAAAPVRPSVRGAASRNAELPRRGTPASHARPGPGPPAAAPTPLAPQARGRGRREPHKLPAVRGAQLHGAHGLRQGQGEGPPCEPGTEEEEVLVCSGAEHRLPVRRQGDHGWRRLR